MADGYKNRRNEVDSSSQEFVTALRDSSTDIVTDPGTKVEKTIINEAAVSLLQLADNLYGGFGSAPKFPNASNLLFLLRAYIFRNYQIRDFVNFTPINGFRRNTRSRRGFLRVTQLIKWLVPHFEKCIDKHFYLRFILNCSR